MTDAVRTALGITEQEAMVLTEVWKRFEGGKPISIDQIREFVPRDFEGTDPADDQYSVHLRILKERGLVEELKEGMLYRPNVEGAIRELEREYNHLETAAEALQRHSAQELLRLQHRYSEKRLEAILPDFTSILQNLANLGPPRRGGLEGVKAYLLKYSASSITSAAANESWLLDYQAALSRVLDSGMDVTIFMPESQPVREVANSQEAESLGLSAENFQIYAEDGWSHLRHIRMGFIESQHAAPGLPVLFLALLDRDPESNVSAGYIMRNPDMIDIIRPMFARLKQESRGLNDD